MAMVGVQTWWIGCSQKWARALTRFTLPKPASAQATIQLASTETVSLSSNNGDVAVTDCENDNSMPTGWRWMEQILGTQITNSILLMAVPKKRTTRTKKRKRMTNKYLSRRTSMVECEFCGEWKRPHFYCTPNCPGRRHLSH